MDIFQKWQPIVRMMVQGEDVTQLVPPQLQDILIKIRLNESPMWCNVQHLFRKFCICLHDAMNLLLTPNAMICTLPPHLVQMLHFAATRSIEIKNENLGNRQQTANAQLGDQKVLYRVHF